MNLFIPASNADTFSDSFAFCHEARWRLLLIRGNGTG